jgi:Putative transmembrane protein (PGPGW)
MDLPFFLSLIERLNDLYNHRAGSPRLPCDRRFYPVAGWMLLIFTPGPGCLVLLLGLTLLAAGFVWARRLMDRMKQEGNRVKNTVMRFGKN